MNIGKDSDKLIDVQDLWKAFHVKSQIIPVLKGINFTVNRGDFVIIFGPSGCGKSTLLNVSLGLEIPNTGLVKLFGTDLYKNTDDTRAEIRKEHIGLIYQQQNWIKALNVVENIAFPLLLRGMPHIDTIIEAGKQLEKVGMSKWAGYTPTELSAGQQQKIALARSLVTAPELIVADEPTGNLDIRSGINLMQSLKKLNEEEGTTIVMVTHDLNYLDYAKKIVHMLDGRVVGEEIIEKNTVEAIRKRLSKKVEIADAEKVAGEINADKQETLRHFAQAESQTPKPNILQRIKNRFASLRHFTVSYFKYSIHAFYLIALFLLLQIKHLSLYLSKSKNNYISSIGKGLSAINRKYTNLQSKFIKDKENTISRIEIVSIAVKGLLVKKSRTFFTIGGIAVGIGVIVLLVSLGYGIEKLVVSRIASLNELHQIDAQPAVASNIDIDEDMISTIEDISGVVEALPVGNLAGKVSYDNSVTDVVVYGVDRKYLEEISIPISPGENFHEESQNENISEAIVNNSFLDVVGIKNNPIDKEFKVNFIVTETTNKETDTDNDEEEATQKTEIATENYKIIGVIEDQEGPFMYIPIQNFEEYGTGVYSEIKVVVEDEASIPAIRREMEAIGLTTTSAVDTVNQVESMFSTLRMILWAIGLFALVVAELGMLNTLTISLLERTREVGFMKVLGMKSDEVRDLFFSESIIMGLLGGVGGLIVGYLIGKLLSLILSTIAYLRGFGSLDITSIPLILTLLILFVSITIGVITGIYPARRAGKISPIDALRYE